MYPKLHPLFIFYPYITFRTTIFVKFLPPNERFCTVVAFGDIPQNAYFSIFYLNFPYCIFRITGPIHPSRIAIMPFEPTD